MRMIFNIPETLSYDELLNILKNNEEYTHLNINENINILENMIKEMNEIGTISLFIMGWYPYIISETNQARFIKDLYDIRTNLSDKKTIDSSFLFKKYELYKFEFKSLSEIDDYIKS